jgi:hypothetical protein
MKKIRLSALLRAASAAFVLTAAGCNRTTLVAIANDGGRTAAGLDAARRDLPEAPPPPAPDVGDDRKSPGTESGMEVGPDVIHEAGTEARFEAGPEALSEVGTEGRLEVGVDLPVEVGSETREAGWEGRPEINSDVPREVGRDVGMDIGSDTWPETGVDGDASRCAAWKSVTSLARVDGSPLPATLVVRGDSIYAGFLSGGSGAAPPTGTIVAVSLSTGQTTTFPLGETLPNQVVAGPGALFYIQGKTVRTTDGWSFQYSDVARLDLATGQVSIIDSKMVDSATPILSVVRNARDDVFWSMLTNNMGPSLIKQWQETTRSGKVVLNWDRPLILLVDQDHFYWRDNLPSGHVGFWSVPTVGGAASQLFESPKAIPDVPSLAGLDDDSLYYAYNTGSPGTSTGIFAMPKAGGEGRVVVANAAPMLMGSQTIDDTHVYWIDQNDQYTIRRALKKGDGSVESFSIGSFSSPEDLLVDGCAVYWTSGMPGQLLVRAK